jgi:hypothetical protein
MSGDSQKFLVTMRNFQGGELNGMSSAADFSGFYEDVIFIGLFDTQEKAFFEMQADARDNIGKSYKGVVINRETSVNLVFYQRDHTKPDGYDRADRPRYVYKITPVNVNERVTDVNIIL